MLRDNRSQIELSKCVDFIKAIIKLDTLKSISLDSGIHEAYNQPDF